MHDDFVYYLSNKKSDYKAILFVVMVYNFFVTIYGPHSESPKSCPPAPPKKKKKNWCAIKIFANRFKLGIYPAP